VSNVWLAEVASHRFVGERPQLCATDVAPGWHEKTAQAEADATKSKTPARCRRYQENPQYYL